MVPVTTGRCSDGTRSLGRDIGNRLSEAIETSDNGIAHWKKVKIKVSIDQPSSKVINTMRFFLHEVSETFIFLLNL